jgi:hypothetical protein
MQRVEMILEEISTLARRGAVACRRADEQIAVI